jgi:uncharacterized membrane protein (UPF0127 family)
MPILRALALLLLALLSTTPSRGADLDHADITITTAAGQSYHFDVEVARTAQQQERGLMFRKSMPVDAGMAFPYDRDTTATFWMKNCYIPLDMLFVASDGRISHIAADAKAIGDKAPGPEDYYPSGGPIRLVIELNGGIAAKLGIHVGDKVVMTKAK